MDHPGNHQTLVDDNIRVKYRTNKPSFHINSEDVTILHPLEPRPGVEGLLQTRRKKKRSKMNNIRRSVVKILPA